jgi:hypothetical protein
MFVLHDILGIAKEVVCGILVVLQKGLKERRPWNVAVEMEIANEAGSDLPQSEYS